MAKISSISPTECRCGFTGEIAFFASDDWKAECPQCGKSLTPGVTPSAGLQVIVRPDGSVNHAFQKGRPPVSRSLPLAKESVPGQPGQVRLRGEVVNRHGYQCREIAKGLYTDMQGRRIVDSTSAAERHAADAGYVRVRDE